MTLADDMAVRANAYAEAAFEQPTIWGESDCTAWARAWVESVRGRRMALPAWRSREEAQAHIAKAGSLAALWSGALSKYGLHERFDEPQAGDVGIIDTHFAGQIGGIFLNHGIFAWRAEPTGARLLRPRPRTIVKVWAVQ
ncbi:DUF6950 family protein [Neorhizobium alkalisoli]|uniref:DUF6950 domain-containing protein n=1 Tax=Neorhizobium alkalisoli TaxID=528178 RepID=A0A561QSB0_9HYPH|nr:hypothetical protein [Neorhizobium alkalisoli]TWF53271.1 hypothetical protein FHW37_104548 [Neorhizobium alkalisoli]